MKYVQNDSILHLILRGICQRMKSPSTNAGSVFENSAGSTIFNTMCQVVVNSLVEQLVHPTFSVAPIAINRLPPAATWSDMKIKHVQQGRWPVSLMYFRVTLHT